jgi:hypothetical protein
MVFKESQARMEFKVKLALMVHRAFRAFRV